MSMFLNNKYNKSRGNKIKMYLVLLNYVHKLLL